MQLQIVEELTPQRISGKGDVAAVETRLGGELPDDYLGFLVKWNGGRPQPSIFTFLESGRMTDSGIQFFFGICDDPIYDIIANLDVYEGRFPRGYCPIACDSFGNLLLLDAVSAARGTVYFWDHERETGDPTMVNMSKVASSFTEFVNALK